MTADGERGTFAEPGTFAERLWRHPSAVLLVVQLFGVLVYPFMDASPVGRAALSLFSLVVLVLAVRAVRATPALTWVSLLLGGPVVVLTILEAIYPSSGTVVFWSSALHAAFYAYTSLALIRYMFLDRFVTLDELWATGATFTVVAWAFAYAFMAVQIVWPARSRPPSRPMRSGHGSSCCSYRSRP